MIGKLKILLIIGAVLVAIVGIWFYFFPPFGEATPLWPDPSRLSLFIYPAKIIADGEDSAKIIAVVKDRQKPVSGVQVFFKTTLGNLSFMEAVTDQNGEAMVFISSEETGEATITAIAGTISRKEIVTFISQESR